MKAIELLVLTSLALGLGSCSDKDTTNTTTEKTTNTIQALATPSLESLKQNPDIVWIGEVYVDYGLNYLSYDATPEEKTAMEALGLKGVNSYKTLKYQIANIDAGDDDEHNLINKLIKDISTISCYKNEQLTEQLSAKESQEIMNSVDTIITFDPKTMKELLQVVVNALNPEDVKFFRVKQIIYYNKKDITFQTIPLAMAPMVCEYNDQGDLLGVSPLFWLKPNFIDAIPSLASEDITWAKRMYRNFPVKDIKVVKEDYPLNKVIDTMLYDLRANADKVVVGSVFDADGTDKMKVAELKNLGASVDTIITFDPVTMKETIKVVRSSFKGKDIEQLRLMQDFVWDAKLKQMNIRYVGFKPIINRYDDSGKFLNAGPIFTLNVADNK